jgi:hypothetical protein
MALNTEVQPPGTLIRKDGALLRKVRFRGDTVAAPYERMWVEVADEDSRVGVLSNDPAVLTWLKYGDAVGFGDDWNARPQEGGNA